MIRYVIILLLISVGLILVNGFLRSARIRREQGQAPLIYVDRKAAIWIIITFVAVIAIVGWFAFLDSKPS